MESGKSWLGVACVAAELLAGRYVVYIHFEEADPSDTIERLLALGIPATLIQSKLRFVGPERPATPFALAMLLDPVPSLVVLDGVNEGMALHNNEIREEGGVAAFRRRLVKPFTAAGAAVLSLDHVVKDPERRSRGPIGSVHKGNALTGSLIVLENVEPFGRGQRGRSHVYVTKDRPGHLRQHGRPDPKTPGKTYLGELVVDDTQHNSPDLELKLWAPRTDGTADAEHSEQEGPNPQDAVLDAIRVINAAGRDANVRAVEAASGIGKSATSRALELLLIEGRITEMAGPRKARIFTPAASECPP
jgi:hypothetical protein